MMDPVDRAANPEFPAEPDLGARCPICGRELWTDGLDPARDGDAWICGDCDQARNFQALDR